MIGLSLSAAKQGFFDRAAVIDATDKGTRQALSKFGAFVRQRARTSIRTRKAVSVPGAPPSSHVGTLKKLIFFAYDKARNSVVIGPTLFKPGSRVPGLLEYGGEAPGAGPDGRPRVFRYRARPYMGPAFRAELGGASALLKDSVKK